MASALRADGAAVRCLVRDRSRAAELERAGCRLAEGDVLDSDTLESALEGIEVAYYLVHSAAALGRRPPLRLSVPLLTPRLSSLWIGLVTPVDAEVARPLIEGLATETVVRDPAEWTSSRSSRPRLRRRCARP